MATLTPKEIQKIEEYYYWVGYKNWIPFPKEPNEKLLKVYGEEPVPYSWTEQDIFEGTRKLIFNYFINHSE
ncbi:hypothetical protein OQ279_17130 [Salinimicrobium sp. MT39]|uniref:Uncharacterized protein n=1 Tax=Salinimicrobium profundisediminis TaxID=2994553 RepID=A0A9X3CZJ0_9FLAO|nr:hypothetical protein [Cytobacillus gottheilii]MCX2839851.1 hypothetical protein [Salinimicrobium profundisediminis]